MSCIPIGSSCKPLIQVECTPKEIFCAWQSRCHEPSDVNCSAPAALKSGVANVDYKIAHNFTFDVNEGYNLRVLERDQIFQVLPGDILGWASATGGKIAYVQGEGRTLRYSILSSADIQPEVNITRSEQHVEYNVTYRVRAIAAQAVSFVTVQQYALPGVYRLQVHLSNLLTSSLSLAPQLVTVQRAVSTIRPSYPGGFRFFGAQVNGVVEMFVNVSVASNLTISWTLVNSSAVLQVKDYSKDLPGPFFLDGFNHSFSALGEYEILVKASNNVSSANTTVIVKVQSKMSDLQLSLTSPGSLIYKGAPIKFNASVANGGDVNFAWRFGDRPRTAFNSNNSITHRFSQTGPHNVTVTASNLASNLHATLEVNVLESVSMAVPSWTVSNTLVNFTCNLTGPFGSSQYFYWDYGDGTKEDGVGKAHVQHKYVRGGTYKISCRIKSDVLLNSSAEIVVEEPVTGLRLKNISGVELNETQTFTALTTTGNQLTYVWYVKSQSVVFLSVCSQSTIDYRFNMTGLYSVSVNVSNSLSSQFASITFPVHVRISGLGITAYPNPVPSNTSVTFRVTKGTGSNVTYRLDLGNGFVAREFGESYQFNRTFQAGRWQIILTGKNPVSHMIVFYNLTVQDVVKDLILSVNSVREFSGQPMVAAGSSAPLTSFCANVSQGSDVYFTWNFEDNDSKTKLLVNRLATGVTESLKSHMFTKEAKFNVSVTASNLISSTSSWLLVHAQEMIEGFAVQVDDGVAPGERLNFKFTKTRGGNVTYVVHFGDGDNLTTRKVSFRKVYTRIGVFNVTAVAQNQISSTSVVKTIYVQLRIKGLRFTKAIAPVPKGNSSVISWSVTNGTNITYEVNFGNGHAPQVLHSNLVGRELSTTHIYSSSGKYSVSVKAYNCIKPAELISDIAVVEEPILGLALYAFSKNVALFDNVKIHAVITQGSGVSYRFDFGDESDPVQGANSVIQHQYKRAGDFRPTVRAWNIISAVTVDANTTIIVAAPSEPQKIRGLRLSCEPTALGNVSQIKVNYDNGFLFQCEINFGDGKRDIFNDSVLYKPIPHVYNKEGPFEVTANCSNRLGNVQANTQAHVDEAITGLKFTSDSGEVTTEFGNSVTMNWTWSSGTNIRFCVSLLNNGAIKYYVEVPSGIVILGRSIFSSPGSYTVIINATNLLTSSQVISANINLEERITGLKMAINPSARARFSIWAHVTITTGSPVNLRWEHGDGKATTQQPQKSVGNGFYSTYVYSKAGNFTVRLTAWNKLSQQNATTVVRVLNPVEGFALLEPKIVTWPSNNIQLEFTRNVSVPAPTDATYNFQYGNGEKSTKTTIDPGKFQFSHNHTFHSPGCYRVMLSIENLVSHLILFTNVQIIEEISELTLTASHSKYAAHPGTPGRGAGKNVFPVEYPVSFNVSHEKGTCVEYVWTFGDFSRNASVRKIDHAYPLPGEYTVRVKVSNKLNTKRKSTKVVLQRSVLGLYLATSGPSRPGENVKFIVFCAQCGTQSTFLLSTGKGKNITLSRPTRKYKSEDKKLLDPNINLPFDPSGYNITVYTHSYDAVDVYEAHVHAWNKASRQSARSVVVITTGSCSPPSVEVLGGGRNLSSAPSFVYGREFTLKSQVEIDCGDDKATFAWTLYTANTFYGNNTDALSLPPEAARMKR